MKKYFVYCLVLNEFHFQPKKKKGKILTKKKKQKHHLQKHPI